MPVTRSRVITSKLPTVRSEICDLNIGTYATGGVSVPGSLFGWQTVLGLSVVGGGSGYVFAYDAANQKLKAYYGDYSEASDGPLVEVPDSTDLGSVTIRVMAFGR